MMAMPVPVAGAIQPPAVFIMAPATSPITAAGLSPPTEEKHQAANGEPVERERSRSPSNHSDASSSDHEHLTEAIKGVLETVLSRQKSHDDEHREGGHSARGEHGTSHLKTGLAVAAGSHLLKRTLQKSAKVRKHPYRRSS